MPIDGVSARGPPRPDAAEAGPPGSLCRMPQGPRACKWEHEHRQGRPGSESDPDVFDKV